MRGRWNYGMVLLAIYLILVGLQGLGLPLGGLSVLVAILALAAGILLLIYR
jgi:hypothetical protein